MDSLLFLYDFHLMYDLFEYFGFKKSCPDPPYHSDYRFLHDFFEYYFQKSHTSPFLFITIVACRMTFLSIISKKSHVTPSLASTSSSSIYFSHPIATFRFQKCITFAGTVLRISAGSLSISETDLYGHMA